MKVFISQPMNGRSNRAIIEERQPIVDAYKREGWEVIDSVLDMGHSRGCRIEHEVAVAYGREVVYG